MLRIALLLVFAVGPVWAQLRIEFPSLDQQDGRPVQLAAYWMAAASDKPRPTVVMLHGCGGIYDRKGVLSQRMRDYATLFNANGWHALMVDSLTPRGELELCTQKYSTRAVTQTNRRRDAIGALQWLALQPAVDPRRLVLLGWSNGGSTVLASTNMSSPEVEKSPVIPRAAVAFYPGCESERKRGYKPQTQLLMLLGGLDDWTPTAPCQEMVDGLKAVKPEIEVYSGAHHGFDTILPVRVRTDVTNAISGEQGVHVGGNAEAMKRSRERLINFLTDQLK